MSALRNLSIVFFGLCLLVTTSCGSPLPSGNSHHDVHTRQSGDSLCYEQDASLLPQANLHAQAALEKADGMYQTLQSLFMDTLSSCQSTFISGSSDVTQPHSVIINSYETGRFDLYPINNLQDQEHDCSHLQYEFNSTISYLECATDYVGLILQNLTTDVIQYGYSNTTSVTRKAVYDIYKNVSWIVDVKKLTKVFPCALNTPQTEAADACTRTYGSIQVNIPEPPLYNTCVKDLLSSEGEIYQKQAVVLAHVTELVKRMKEKMETYIDVCLSSDTAA